MENENFEAGWRTTRAAAYLDQENVLPKLIFVRVDSLTTRRAAGPGDL
jgi:hypothetical protein